MKKLYFDFDFKTLAVKGRSSMGNILSRNAVKRIELKDAGVSTLGARKIWYDDTIKRLNVDGRGQYLGEFKGSDKILTLMDAGAYKLVSYDLGTHFEEDMFRLAKHYPERILTAVYRDKNTKLWYIKRFQIEESEKRQSFIEEESGELMNLNMDFYPRLRIVFDSKANKKECEDQEVDVTGFIGVKGFKAKGKRVTTHSIDTVNELEPTRFPTTKDISDNNNSDEENNTDGQQSSSDLLDEITGQMKIFDNNAP